MGTYISKSKHCYNAKPSAYYFYAKTKILVDFPICISVPLKEAGCNYHAQEEKGFIGIMTYQSNPADQSNPINPITVETYVAKATSD